MSEYTVTDKRGPRARSGLIVGQSVSAAKRMATEGVVTPGRPDSASPVTKGSMTAPTDNVVSEMRLNRSVNGRKEALLRGGGDVSFATMRPRDPMFYWKQNNLPYDVTKPEQLVKIRSYCRLLYMTHPIVASCIDIYSKYPLTGMELTCKDDQLTEFYTSLFFDELNYEEFLLDVGREYWTVGEAWPLGSFNESLGVWEDDELLNPEDVEVERSPFLKDPRFFIRLPESLRDVLQSREPAWEYNALMASYPELAAYMGQDALMPVSNVLLKQLKFKADTFHKRGIPILMRGFRAIIQEEMLNAAMDSVADRLYTPLILAKLGASASDLGTTVPWIPTPEDLAEFEGSLDAALAGDFRVLTHHFAVDMQSVFGREQMPNMDGDFERIEERILQVFGLSKTMLSGASGGETYAADALNRDLISQLLTHYQRMVKKLYRDRALIVAEAQEHYDYEVRGGKRYPIMEEVLEVDEETGEQRIVEQPKLLVPDLNMKTMNVADEESERQFREALSSAGVPISMKTRLVNVPIEFDDEIEQRKAEVVALAVAEQEARKEVYKALKAQGLPIPQDLKDDFEPKAANAGIDEGANGDTRLPLLGTDPVVSTPNLAPDEQDMQETPPDQADNTGPVPTDPTPLATVVPLPQNMVAQRPEESDEMRARMPKPASVKVEDSDGNVTEVRAILGQGPRHVGMRRWANVSKNTPLGEEQTG